MFKLSTLLTILFSFTMQAAIDISQMTLEEKVGQILMIHFHGDEFNEEAQDYLEELKCGSIIFYSWSNDLNDLEKIKALSLDLKACAQSQPLKIPLLIAVDQEGGIVNRITSVPLMPGNFALGKINEPELAYLSGLAIGSQLKQLGIDLNFAPVVDLVSDKTPSAIGLRSFGSSPYLVSSMAEATIDGFHDAGILCCLKHYPGIGDTSIDTHEEMPILDKEIAELWERELIPYRLLNNKADAVMSGHVKLQKIDPSHCVTTSASALSLLQETIGFKKVIFSDSLVMQGVLKQFDLIEEAAIAAFNAGCDILVLGGRVLGNEGAEIELAYEDIERIANALILAVSKGLISKSRLDEAVQKVLALKESLSSFKEGIELTEKEQNEIAYKIALKAADKFVNRSDFPFESKNLCVIAPKILKSSIEKHGFFQKYPAYYYDTQTDGKIFLSLIHDKEGLIFIECDSWKEKRLKEMISYAFEKPCIFVSVGFPLEKKEAEKATFVINTYSRVPASLKAVEELLKE